MKALEKEFVKILEDAGGKVYLVGGIVRDMFLGRESKDLDVLVTGLPMETLLSLLKPLGRVDVVGVSFGVIKFKPYGETEDIDIALPRTEVKTGEGHQGFDVTVDHTLSIEDDLARRDFTMNAIAMDSDGNYIDPYDGRLHIKCKMLKVVNEKTSFKDDPLRIMRGIQFAARFGFAFEYFTWESVIEYKHLLKEISGERIHVELEKLMKGDVNYGRDLLLGSGVRKVITGVDVDTYYSSNKIESIPQLLFVLCSGEIKFHRRHPVLTETLRLTKEESKELEVLFTVPHLETRMRMFECAKSWPGIYDTNFFRSEKIVNMLQEFNSGKYPKNLKEVDITSEKLMELGVQDLHLGLVYRSIVQAIMEDKILNTSQQIEEYVVDYLKKV